MLRIETCKASKARDTASMMNEQIPFNLVYQPAQTILSNILLNNLDRQNEKLSLEEVDSRQVDSGNLMNSVVSTVLLRLKIGGDDPHDEA